MASYTPEAIEQLRAAFIGEVLVPGDPGYDDARQIHNGLIDKRPAVIAQCRDTADVADAVKFARENDLEISVRGGGHNVAGLAVTEGGLMIDLAPMKGIHVNPARGTASAQGGITWGEYNRATHLHGLVTTGGVISTTGIAGLTLGGGVGFLMGKYGMAIDHLLSVELVTADGEVRMVSEETDPDLFWAVRGGGGNFGVATWFQYRTNPLATVLGGIAAYPLADAQRVFEVVRDVASTAPDELTMFAGLVHAPDGSGAKLTAVVVCHCGELAQAEKDVAPLRSIGTPLLDVIQPMPYPVVNTLLDGGFPKGARNYWKSAFFKDVDDEVVGTMASALEKAPSTMSGMVVEHFHGEVTRIGATDTAFPHRSPGFNLALTGEWLEPADDDANIGWVRDTFASLEPHMADAAYVNYLDVDSDRTSRVRTAYGPNYARLLELKRRYDPDNVFHLNQNIDPAE